MDDTIRGLPRDAAADKSLREMNASLRRKLSLLRDMRELSEQAGNYLDEENVERLDNIIASKQALILEIDHLDKLFLNAFNAVKTDQGISALDELHPRHRAELTELRSNTSDILGLLQIIYDNDIKTYGDIVKLRELAASDLARIRSQKNISRLYSNAGPGPAAGQKAERPFHYSPSGFDLKK